jgi:hypothetical protein
MTMSNNTVNNDTVKNTVVCGDAEALVGFLYDECTPDERARMEQHLQACDACATELAELGGARRQLTAWAPPDAALGFHIASEPVAPAAPVRVAWWRQPMPVWGQAVAAVALFGLGLAAGSRGMGVAPSTTQNASAVVSPAALAQLESRMKQEIAAIRAVSPAPAPAPASSAPRDEEAVMRQVRQMLRDSEDRQQEAFTVRVAQIARDAEIQRRVDQAQMQQTLVQMQGTTSEEVRRQREMLNYLVNVSQRGGAR